MENDDRAMGHGILGVNPAPKLVSKLSLKSIPPKNGFVTNYAGNGKQTGIPTIKWMDKWMDLY